MPSPRAAGPERFPGVLSGFHVEGDPSGAGTGLLHGGESWVSTSYFVDAHRHDGWEVYLQADGRMAWRAGGQAVDLLPGNVLAVPPGTVHEMVARPSARHHFFYAAFDLAGVARRHPALQAAWQDAPLLHVTGERLVVNHPRLTDHHPVARVAVDQPTPGPVDVVNLGLIPLVADGPLDPGRGRRHGRVVR